VVGLVEVPFVTRRCCSSRRICRIGVARTPFCTVIFSGCYGNRDHRPGSSVHRELAQMADDDDVTNCLYSPLFKYPFRGHTVTCRITLPMNSNTDNTLSAAGCVMN
jgi:hypothetical protein